MHDNETNAGAITDYLPSCIDADRGASAGSVGVRNQRAKRQVDACDGRRSAWMPAGVPSFHWTGPTPNLPDRTW